MMVSADTGLVCWSSAELLRIDASAELARVTESWLQGPWQVPAELARALIRNGAQKICITCGRRGVRIVSEGARVPRLYLEALVVAFGTGGSDHERHRALVELERRGGLSLVWAGGLPAARLALTSFSDDGCRRLLLKADEQPVLAGSPEADSPRVEIELRSPALDPSRAAEWLATVCRFATVPVELNGDEIPRGFPPGLLHVRLRAPLPGFLTITRHGDAPRLWLLQHGVTSTRATIPGYPAFDAALELGAVVPGPASGAALREAVTPYLTRVVEQAVSVTQRLVPRLPDLDEEDRQRVASLLLDAVRLGIDRPAIRRQPIIREIGQHAERQRWRTLEQLDDAGAASGHPTAVLEPADDPRRFTLGAGALVADAKVRLLLSETSGLRLETPPLAGSRRRPLLLAAWRWLASRRRRVREIDPGDLTADDRAVLDEIERWALCDSDGRPVRVAFRRGTGSLCRVSRRSTRVLVPRDDPVISATLAKINRRPAWLYVLLLQILDGIGEPPTEVRAAWLRHELQDGVGGLSLRR